MNIQSDFNKFFSFSSKERAEYDFIHYGRAEINEDDEYINAYSKLVWESNNAEKHERRIPR